MHRASRPIRERLQSSVGGIHAHLQIKMGMRRLSRKSCLSGRPFRRLIVTNHRERCSVARRNKSPPPLSLATLSDLAVDHIGIVQVGRLISTATAAETGAAVKRPTPKLRGHIGTQEPLENQLPQ